MTTQGASLQQKAISQITKIVRSADQNHVSTDQVIVEAPLQILIQQPASITLLATVMRTPGDDELLVLGFLFSENIITSTSDIVAINQDEENEVIITLTPDLTEEIEQQTRPFVSYSGCGICGKTSIKQLSLQSHRMIDESAAWLPFNKLLIAVSELKAKQPIFEKTGGVHGAALIVFDQGSFQWLACKEDVGRHNAVDKVIGKHLLDNSIPKSVLLLSGRISFELVQKAVMAGISTIAAIGAPSSLAVQTAKQFNLTLIGFSTQNQANIYCGDWRLQKTSQEFIDEND